MLFDLRGRGRRRTVQIIYASLAILMGGGLVLFGIGSSTSGGGILDAVVGDGGNNASATDTIDKRIKTALAKTKATPTEPAPWAELARLRYQRANIDGLGPDDTTYTDKGKERLRLATAAWERYLGLEPKNPDAGVARLMVNAYGAAGVNEPAKAVSALQIVTAAEDPPSSNLYAQLAQLAYIARDNRTGDLAAGRAVDLAEDGQKKTLRTQLQSIKAQAAAQPATTTG